MKAIIKYFYHGEPHELILTFESELEKSKYNFDLFSNNIIDNGLEIIIESDRSLDDFIIPSKQIKYQIEQFTDLGVIENKLSLIFQDEVKDTRLLEKYLLWEKKKTFPYTRMIKIPSSNTNEQYFIVLKQFFYDPFFENKLKTISNMGDFTLNLDRYSWLIGKIWNILFSKSILNNSESNEEELTEIVKIISIELKKAKKSLQQQSPEKREEKYKSTLSFIKWFIPLHKRFILSLKKTWG